VKPEIESIPIGELLPAAYNPRKDLKPGDQEYDALKASIGAFGFLELVVWNRKTGNVVGGHQRLKVLQEQGVTHVPCVVVDFDEDTEKAANLALNKIRGDWDFPKLADALLGLDAVNFDLSLTGFEPGEIKNIMAWTATEDKSEAASAISRENECPKCGFRW
jgi:ParB-like chromosome segregation protein Spo0J